METNYSKYRGKCKELCEKAIKEDPTLTIVRGYYFEPLWDTEEPHWWTVKPDGTIYDPSVKQFPSIGAGIYTEFDGNVICENCGKVTKEENSQHIGNYPVCSNTCAMRVVGL